MTDPRRGAPGDTPDDGDAMEAPAATQADEVTAEAIPAEAEEPTEPAIPVAVEGDPVEADPDFAADTQRPAGRERERVGERDRERERDARGTRQRAVAPVASPSEQAVHVDDRISSLFVAVIVAVFVLIILNGLLLGRNGALSPRPTPTPVPTVTAAPSVGPSPSVTVSPAASGSPVASGSPAASGSPVASGSASVSPSASPAPSAS
jgi:hypothetical protein